MRSVSLATQQALTEARDKGLAPRQLLWITVKDRTTGAPGSFGFWSGDYPVDIPVISGTTGLQVTRTYTGDVNLSIGNIPRVSDLSMVQVEITMSAIPTITQQIVRGYEARLAKVEIHSLQLSPATRQPVAAAEIEFLAEVDSAPIETGAAGGESLIKFSVVSDAISMLTRTNPRRRSDEAQQLRGGDRINRYSNAISTWKIAWGQD